MLWKLADIRIGPSQIMELSGEVGRELAEHLRQQAQAHAAETLPPQYADPPDLVAVAVDGGRIMTRVDGGRGVHGEAWKETKNACLMTMNGTPSEQDPHPELPTCFSNQAYVEQLVREVHASTTATAANAKIPAVFPQPEPRLPAAAVPAELPAAPVESLPKWIPTRKVRTCVSSMVSSDEFGPLVAGEAQRRGFYQAARRACLGDGQAWNWTLHKTHFPDFVPIADFVHPLGYIYDAAKVLAPDDPWPLHLRGATACWQGRIDDFLEELRAWQVSHPTPADTKLPDDDPRAIVQTTLTYLEHNRERMDYPAYRRQGLPISTSMIESLIKEINFRVKGTEKFWNRPDGAEQILQIRAAALSDDDRLSQWILHRPGALFHRSSTQQLHPLAIAG